MAIGNDVIWQRFCAAAALPELAADERLRDNAGRRAHRAEVVAAVAARLAGRTAAQWLDRAARGRRARLAGPGAVRGHVGPAGGGPRGRAPGPRFGRAAQRGPQPLPVRLAAGAAQRALPGAGGAHRSRSCGRTASPTPRSTTWWTPARSSRTAARPGRGRRDRRPPRDGRPGRPGRRRADRPSAGAQRAQHPGAARAGRRDRRARRRGGARRRPDRHRRPCLQRRCRPGRAGRPVGGAGARRAQRGPGGRRPHRARARPGDRRGERPRPRRRLRDRARLHLRRAGRRTPSSACRRRAWA